MLGHRTLHCVAGSLIALPLMGCGTKSPDFTAPTWKPAKFAEAVLAELDADGNGLIDEQELVGAPGLTFGAKLIDADRDGGLSADELTKRFEIYRDMQLVTELKEMVLVYKRRPVRMANVRLVPEFFLDGVLEPATDTTTDDGSFFPQAEGVGAAGLRVGYYRVVVDSPKVTVPEKYSSEATTPLGVEVSPIADDPSTYSRIFLTIEDE